MPHLGNYVPEIAGGCILAYGKDRIDAAKQVSLMIMTFRAFLLFVVAYAAQDRTADPRAPFETVMRVRQEMNVAFTAQEEL